MHWLQVILTMEHILIRYAELAVARRKFYNVSNMWEMFDYVPMRDVIKFIKDLGLKQTPGHCSRFNTIC